MGQYGFFDDANREYVITEHFTPLPWINFLCNKDFTAIISQAGGGTAFYRESSSGRLTRYNQTRVAPVDRPGFYIYLRDKNGDVFCPTYEPVRAPLENWKCRHGLGYTVFESEYKGLKTETTYFVPRKDNVVLWNLKITNNRGEPADLSAFSYVEWTFHRVDREYLGFHWNRFYHDSVFSSEKNAVLYDCHVFEDLPKLKVYLSSSEPVDAYDCDRNRFLGRGGMPDMPLAVKNGRLSCDNKPSSGYTIGAIQNNLKIAPGQTAEITFMLGSDPTWETADKVMVKYKCSENVKTALCEVKKYWNDYISAFNCDLPDKDMERMINIWNPYNCYHSFNRKMSVTGMTPGYEKGGVQSRDSSQDCMSLITLEPSIVKERMDAILRFQRPDGNFFDCFDIESQKPFDHHSGAERCDNAVWVVYTIYDMISEWDDIDFLDKQFPYYKGENASVLDHLYKGLEWIAADKGKNGLPKIRGVDWNDNLYMFTESGDEETVMIAQQLVYACRLLSELAAKKDRRDIIEFCEAVISDMTKALNTDVIWDGDWYKRLIYPTDTVDLGSKDRQEGKIYLNTQSWAVISETATDGRDVHCMDKAKEILDTSYGIKLLFPAFTGVPTPDDPIYNNGPGIRENGGIFHHANTWAIIAETILGRGDQAFDYFRKILPNVSSEERGADVFVNEPYAFSSTALADPDPRPGEGDMAWFSGTVTWMYLAGVQYILGIKAVPDGLKIDPCIPKDWDGFKVVRKFRGCTYNIEVKNPSHINKGIKSIIADGEAIDGNILNVCGKKEVSVEVIMG